MNLSYLFKVTDSWTRAEAEFRDRFWGRLIPGHNWPSPNILTLIRMVGSVLLVLIPLSKSWFLASAIFLFFTDYFDGIIARTQDKQTPFGKWADHTADRMLVVSIIYFLYTQNPVWLHYFMLILIPEVITLCIWLILLFQGKPAKSIPNGWGRTKFVIYCFALGIGIINHHSIGGFLIYVGLAFGYLGNFIEAERIFISKKTS